MARVMVMKTQLAKPLNDAYIVANPISFLQIIQRYIAPFLVTKKTRKFKHQQPTLSRLLARLLLGTFTFTHAQYLL